MTEPPSPPLIPCDAPGSEEQQRVRELAALFAVSAAINHAISEADALGAALRQVLQVLCLDSGRIYLLDETTGEYALAAAEGEAGALLARSHRGIRDFKVQNIGEEILRVRGEVDKLIRNWTVVLASIAGISLLVGGIGIFSVMQISISERTYEIGLRKSIGATDGEIFGQFLIESVSLSLLGGLLGTGLGFGVTLLASQAFEDGLAVSPVALALAAAFAIVIGLAAGVYPALRASRMAPVDALRAL